jgi:thiamine biosynthesis lipoprotein
VTFRFAGRTPQVRLRSSSVAAAACSALLLAGACGAATPPAAALVEQARLAMGSEVKLTAWSSDEPTALAAFEAVFTEFDRLEALLSVWREGSDAQRLNAAAGLHPVAVSAETIAVLTVARQIGDWTEGKFDVTFAALSDLWKFDHDQDNSIPSQADIQQRLPLIDYRQVEFDAAAHTAFVRRKGMRVHFGGIGKGYAVDRAVAILRRRGLRDFMIQAGGDMYVAGRHGERTWRLGIQDPRGPGGRSFASIELSDATFSTSGDYERFFIKDGRRYHHIIDPDRGEPAAGCRSVTIVTERAVLADSLSTGVFVMGPAKGMALIERLPQVEGVIVSAENEVLVSSGLKDSLRIISPPTERRP